MSAHVAPHRWADLWAGRVGTAERALMERHAAVCGSCRRTRARVQRASDTFSTIRDTKAPDVAWDAVRAQVHWSVSTERRAKVPPPRRWPVWAGFGVALSGAVALALVTGPIAVGRDGGESPGSSHTLATIPSTIPAAPPAALVGLVNRTNGGDVLVDGIRPKELFSRRLVAGDTLVTGDGSVDVQFGEASAFALGPRSRLELRRFDVGAIELVVEGTLDVLVAPRARDQRFTVIAGDRVVEVRGTQFRVQHRAGTPTTVACRHGLVAVGKADTSAKVEVGAARYVTLQPAREKARAEGEPEKARAEGEPEKARAEGEPEKARAEGEPEKVVVLGTEDMIALAEATPLALPMWNPEVFERGSAPLEIATAGRREVRLDGVEIGQAPLSVRVMPGRHTVEATDNAGRYRRAGWVDVTAPGSGGVARLEIPAEPPPTADISARRRQFQSTIDHTRLSACTRAHAKQGLVRGAYVQIDITVDAQGAINALNVIDTDLTQNIRDCVKAAIHGALRFPPGAAGRWLERVEL